MKQKQRFGNLNLGEKFEWGGKSLVKDGERTATSMSPRANFVFSPKDVVTVTEPDVAEDDDDMFHDGFGCISGGIVSDPQDLYDAYVYHTAGSDNIKDRCN